MLIVMAGLPGTGKSTLSARLAAELDAVVLDKDAVRSVLFPPPICEYPSAQDDICMAALYRAAVNILTTFPDRTVILDGRTFAREYQVRDLLTQIATLHETPRILLCTCADEVARQRLEKDQAAGKHPAANRTFALYTALKAAAEPLTVPHLVVDTGQPLEVCVQRCLDYLRGG
jgi:predicted kinase